jgi:hypothetical protein
MVGYSEVRVRSRGYKEVEIVEMKMRKENITTDVITIDA